MRLYWSCGNRYRQIANKRAVNRLNGNPNDEWILTKRAVRRYFVSCVKLLSLRLTGNSKFLLS
jgi:hypothetical protein